MKKLKKKGLGRGLSALFGDQKPSSEKNDTDIQQRKALIGDLNRNRFQPRIHFDDNKLSELASSIKNNGVIQPIAVRKDEQEKGKYEIVAGERRWLAAQKAGLHEVPIIVLNLSDNESLEVAILENIQREDLNCVEEAKGYERLHKEFYYDQERIAKMMSKSRSHIANTLRLLSLPKDVVSMLEMGLITAGQARPLVGLSNASSIAEEIVNKKLSARQIESFVRETKSKKTDLIIDSNITEIQKRIEGDLGLRVVINNKKNNSGKITIEYKNLEQFDLLSRLLRHD
ncbi:MAG: chromosome partitioning protein, ParB family [Pelagibacterales bacterium]|jgi:ParB family chromosome partitioning protein|nr:chromosome partitioning protein, ParB family [Pelagibacterales bacterium]